MRRVLTRHWQLRVLCLLAAAGLWAWVVTSNRTQLAVAAPLEYIGVPDELVVVGPPRETADVYLDVPRWAIGRVGADRVHVRVDVSGLHEGESVATITPADVDVPPGVRVTHITPSRVVVALAPAAQSTLPVVAQIRGEPAPGHAVHGVQVQPSTVQVRGPRSTIQAQAAVETAPVDVSGRRGPLTQTVGLVLPAFVYATKDRSVQVRVDIEPEGRMRESKR
jgi:YbbR domain-containing protein